MVPWRKKQYVDVRIRIWEQRYQDILMIVCVRSQHTQIFIKVTEKGTKKKELINEFNLYYSL